jgi:hypothetical protein
MEFANVDLSHFLEKDSIHSNDPLPLANCVFIICLTQIDRCQDTIAILGISNEIRMAPEEQLRCENNLNIIRKILGQLASSNPQNIFFPSNTV